MRVAWLALALVACFRPSPPEGQPCGPDRWCPSPLACASDGTCRSTDREPDGGGSGDPDARVPDADPSTANVAFVAMPPVTPTALGPPATADAKCTALAKAAGRDGNFIAWVSTAASPAPARLRSARGWVRTDGRPFADTRNDLLAGRIYYPLRRDQNDIDRQVVVLTGTTDAGAASGEDCNGFASNAPGELGVVGESDATSVRWTNDSEAACDGVFSYYCLQIDHDFALAKPNATGKRVFLTDGRIAGTAGLLAMDALCQTEATAESLGGTWSALVSTTTVTALARVGGSPATPWVRLDGVAATSDFVTLDAPVVVTSRRAYVDESVWAGALRADRVAAAPSASCADWTATGLSGLTGQSSRSGPRAFGDASAGACNSPRRLYCVEK